MIWKKLIACTACILIIATSACSKNESDANPDASTIYTQVAKTVQFQLTQAGGVKPSETNAPKPIKTEPAMSTFTSIPGDGVTQPAPIPTNTIQVDDRAEWVSNLPADGASVLANSEFQVTWFIKNSGKTTWTPNYAFRFYAGDKLGSSNIQVSKNIKPGEETQLTVNMVAPSSTGKYNSIWVLTNDQGINFYSVTINIKVTNEVPSATPETPTPTQTETPIFSTTTVPTSSTIQPTEQQ